MIFHFLTNQPEAKAVFENDHRKIDPNKEIGAVSNDYDFQPDSIKQQ